MTLSKSLKTARRALTDVMARDVVKLIKSGLTDKSLPVQRAASEVRYLFDYGFFVITKIIRLSSRCIPAILVSRL